MSADSELTIHHDYDSGTTVQGTVKNSPAHLALKAHPSWVWSRYASAWLLRSSRHRRPKRRWIDEIERVLTGHGYTITRDLDEAMPSVAEQEQDRADRMDRRSDRLAERADKQAEQAAVTRKKATDVFDSIPFGQPILIGHHSEKADRNRRERATKNMWKSFDQANHAADLARRSETAAQHMDYRTIPTTVDNRIEKLEADRRRWQRELDGEPGLESYTDEHGQPRLRRITRYPSEKRGERLRQEIAELDEQLEYWRGEYRRLQQEGKASTIGPDEVAKGDWILRRGDWMRVRRVNRKSVSVPNPVFPAVGPGEREHSWTIKWAEIAEHRTTEQMPPEFVEQYETAGVDRIYLYRGWQNRI